MYLEEAIGESKREGEREEGSRQTEGRPGDERERRGPRVRRRECGAQGGIKNTLFDGRARC